MIINESVIEIIDEYTSNLKFETGGILGSSNGKEITDVIIDKNEMCLQQICSYAPDVDFFNSCLNEWSKAGKCFLGMFHTHFCGVKTLSSADKKYIYEIMFSMPKSVNELFFPLFVLPDRELISYKATRNGDMIFIENDLLEVIKNKGGVADDI